MRQPRLRDIRQRKVAAKESGKTEDQGDSRLAKSIQTTLKDMPPEKRRKMKQMNRDLRGTYGKTAAKLMRPMIATALTAGAMASSDAEVATREMSVAEDSC